MRPLHVLALGLGLSFAFVGSANAAPPVAMSAKTFRMVKGTDHALVTKSFRGKMADVIEGVGTQAGHASDTPELRIVPMSGGLIKTKLAATEVNDHDIGGPGAEFAYHGAAQPTKFKLLIPVSGHYGLPYKKYAATNEYQVTVQDKAGNTIYSKRILSTAHGKSESSITREDLITEHEIELPFNAGKEFKVSFWPTATSKGGYTAGREVVVRLAQ